MAVNRKEILRFIRFGFVGIIGAIVDFSIMNLLTRVFRFDLVSAGSISFTFAVISNFIFNRFWTYPDSRSKKIEKQLVMFFIVNIIGISIRIPILHFIEPIISQTVGKISMISADQSIFLTNNITLAIAIVIVLFWNFFANRYWTYNDVK
ncbi:GtrA family protein [Chloroflexota bacterium]